MEGAHYGHGRKHGGGMTDQWFPPNEAISRLGSIAAGTRVTRIQKGIATSSAGDTVIHTVGGSNALYISSLWLSLTSSSGSQTASLQIHDGSSTTLIIGRISAENTAYANVFSLTCPYPMRVPGGSNVRANLSADGVVSAMILGWEEHDLHHP